MDIQPEYRFCQKLFSAMALSSLQYVTFGNETLSGAVFMKVICEFVSETYSLFNATIVFQYLESFLVERIFPQVRTEPCNLWALWGISQCVG